MAAWFWWLERVGFGRVLVLDGSIDVLAGQLPPQGFAAAPVDSFEFLALCRDSLSISADSLMWKLGEPGTEILDLRGDEAWQAGHIPQALSFDMDEYLPAEGWPDPREARKLLSLFGPRDRDPVDLQAVFVICGHHSWNAEPYLAWMLLKMMGVKARVLDGGFSQWREWGDRPVVRIVDDDEVVEFLEQPDEPPILLDLRGHRDWRRSHIPGSVCLPAHVFADSLETVLEEHWPGADRGRRPMILYCYGADCVRSRNGATLAARAGFLKLLWYRDGIEGWRAAGRPVEP